MRRLIDSREMLPRGSRVVCALSGGADSVCLLSGLYELRQELDIGLYAAHYHHGIRGEEADRDEAFVRALMERRFPDVPLYVGRGDVPAEARRLGRGLEETARDMRYTFLNEIAEGLGARRIATAHTADDNAETVLLHLGRGTGLQGLTGIPPVRGMVIRPLLTTTRAEVEDYLAARELPFVQDSTNGDESYARNRVRRRVVPVLEELYPGFAARLSENSLRLQGDGDYLAARAAELSDQAAWEGETLTLPAALLARAPDPIALRAVRQLLSRLRAGDDSCSASHLEGVVALCRGEAPSARMDLPGGLQAVREYELLRLMPPQERAALTPCAVALPGCTRAGEWTVGCTCGTYAAQEQTGESLWLSREKVPSLLVRARQVGDTLKLPNRPTKTVKKWMVDEKIPRRERDGLPVFVCEGQVAAVAGLGTAQWAAPAPGEGCWHLELKRRD